MKKFLPIIILLVIVAGLGITSLVVQKSTENRQKAAPTTSITLVGPTSTITSGSNFTVDVNVNAVSNHIVASELFINYDQGKLRGVSFDNGTYLGQVLENGTFQNGVAHLTLNADFSIPNNSSTGSGTLARLVFTPLVSGQTTVTVDTQKTTLVDIDPQEGNVLQSAVNADLTISPTAAEVPDTVLSFSSSSNVLSGTSFFPVDIAMNTGANRVAAAELVIHFDPQYLTGTSFGVNSNGPLPNVIDSGTFDNTAGIARIVLGGPSSGPFTGSGVIATINFSVGNSPGIAGLSFDTQLTKVVSVDTSISVLKQAVSKQITISSTAASPGPSVSPQPSTSPLPSGSPGASNSPGAYSLDIFPTNGNINMPVSAPNTGYAAYVILKNYPSATVVTNQTDFQYNWSVDNGALATLAPFTACTNGILSPCPFDHVGIVGNQLGSTMIHVTVTQISAQSVVANATFNLSVDDVVILPSPTPQASASSNSQLASANFLFSFEGIFSARPDQILHIAAAPSGSQQMVRDGYFLFASQADGSFYRPTPVFTNLDPGNYDVYVTGPNQLRKKYPVALNGGIENIDLASQPLLSGDGDGNNKVNIFDYNLIVLYFGPNYTPQGSIVDFDFDSDVDIFDYTLFLRNYLKLGD